MILTQVADVKYRMSQRFIYRTQKIFGHTISSTKLDV